MNSQENIKLKQAQKRVKDIKGFYTHSTIFIFVNLLVLAANTNFFTAFYLEDYGFWRYFATPVFWGVGLLIHGLLVFMPSLNFIKKWEERKIKELINKDSTHNKY
ncbi:hypothetical protein SCB49_13940 [unidentified eubacterium SCB49]|nr:hypothetical protein SCB49_13940 [unidentified eubacterium SCB49]